MARRLLGCVAASLIAALAWLFWHSQSEPKPLRRVRYSAEDLGHMRAEQLARMEARAKLDEEISDEHIRMLEEPQRDPR